MTYPWRCAWCKAVFVWQDRRTPTQVRGGGAYQFCSEHCLEAWQAERIPLAIWDAERGR